MGKNVFIKDWIFSNKSIFISITIFSSITCASEIFDINAINTGIDNHLSDPMLLNYLSKSEGQLPGRYRVHIYLNDDSVADEYIEFIFSEENQTLEPQITRRQLINWGVKPSIFFKNDSSEIDEFIDVRKFIKGGNIYHDFFSNRLNISVPQIAMKTISRGYINPIEWDDGVAGLFINYSARFNQSWKSPNNHKSIYFGLRNGVNWEAWRLRNHSYYNNVYGDSRWNSLQTFLERNIRSLNSHLIIGETSSDNGIMDTFQYRGLKLMSEESMLPQSQRGFAPTVNGIANSNAVVIVRQNGQIIYQTSVPAGEFTLNDLYPTSFNGELQVTIEESDGSTRVFTQPFSSVPVMQRAGTLKYSMEFGKSRAESEERQPYFVQFSGIYGLPIHLSHYGNLSLLGGVFISEYRQTYTVGAGVNLGNFGGASLDMTHSTSQWDPNLKSTEQTYRFQYNKYVQNTATGLNLSAQYSVEPDGDNFISQTANMDRMSKKQRLQISLSQSLGNWGSLNINGYQQEYWAQSGSDKNFTVSLASQYQSVNYSFSYSHSEQYHREKRDKVFSFTCSMPLRWGENIYWGNYHYNTSRYAGGISTISLSGSALDSHQLRYDLTQQYHHKNQQVSYGVRGSYLTSHGEFALGWDHSPRHQIVHAAATGAFLFHHGGVTASRSFSDAIGLVKAEGINNLKINNVPSLYTNEQGYAVIPMLTQYERNNVSVDTSTLIGNYDVALNSTTVVPTRGAIVLMDFKAKRGGRIVLKLKHNNQLVGFGTQVNVLEQQHKISSGIVATDGEVYLSGVPENSVIQVKWGANQSQQCQLPLHIDLSNSNIQFIEGTCQ